MSKLKPISIPKYRTIKTGKGECDFCHTDDVEGYIGEVTSLQENIKYTGSKMVIDDWSYKNYGFLGSKGGKFIEGDYNYKSIYEYSGLKEIKIGVLICENCIKIMSKK